MAARDSPAGRGKPTGGRLCVLVMPGLHNVANSVDWLVDSGIAAGRIFDRIPGCGKMRGMIRSFGDKSTEALFRDEFVRKFQGIARPAKRKLEAVNAANRLEDLL